MVEIAGSGLSLKAKEVEQIPLEDRLNNIEKEIQQNKTQKGIYVGLITAGLTLVATKTIESSFGIDIYNLFEGLTSIYLGITSFAKFEQDGYLLDLGLYLEPNEREEKILAKKFKELEKEYDIKPLQTTKATENLDIRMQRAISLMYMSNNFSKINFEDRGELLNPEKELPESDSVPIAYIQDNKIIAYGNFNLSESKVNKKFKGPIEENNKIIYLTYNLENDNPELEENHELIVIDKEKGQISFENLSEGLNYWVLHSTRSYITKERKFLVAAVDCRTEEKYNNTNTIDPSKSYLHMFKSENLTKEEWTSRVQKE